MLVARPRAFSLVPAALALVFALASTGGCKPKVGDRCKGAAKVCQDGKTMLVCADGTLQLAPCKGAKGCQAKGEDDATCDYTANEAGDPCPSFRGFKLCTPDGKSLLECPADKWSTQICKGPKHCSMDSDGASCDRTRAEIGDACATTKPYLCSLDEKYELWCDEATHKYVASRVCSGPHKCGTDTGAVFCDAEGPHEAGEPCKANSGFCTADGRQKLQCEKGKFVATDCPGMYGCKAYGRACDLGTALVDGACGDGDLACSDDGKERLACKKKKVKDADGKPQDAWLFAKEKECPGGCSAKAGAIECK